MVGSAVLPLLRAIEGSTDRQAVILGIAFVDTMLGIALRSYFLSSDDHDRAFDFGQPLQPLYNKLVVAYHFGIIPKGIKLDLERLTRIRNRFAHDFEDYSLESVEHDIALECHSLSSLLNSDEILAFAVRISGNVATKSTQSDGEENGLPEREEKRLRIGDEFGNIIVDIDISEPDSNRDRFNKTIQFIWYYFTLISKFDLLMPGLQSPGPWRGKQPQELGDDTPPSESWSQTRTP